MAQSSKEKSALYAKRQKDMDRLGRKVWATIHEHDKIQLLLSQLRGEDGLDWYECEMSGHLRAIGNKGEYWIEEAAWCYLTIVSPTPAGPEIEQLWHGPDVDEAKAFAEAHDSKS